MKTSRSANAKYCQTLKESVLTRPMKNRPGNRAKVLPIMQSYPVRHYKHTRLLNDEIESTKHLINLGRAYSYYVYDSKVLKQNKKGLQID